MDQSYNQYGYVKSRLLTLVDPTGFAEDSPKPIDCMDSPGCSGGDGSAADNFDGCSRCTGPGYAQALSGRSVVGLQVCASEHPELFQAGVSIATNSTGSAEIIVLQCEWLGAADCASGR